jgi:hypothetical protein
MVHIVYQSLRGMRRNLNNLPFRGGDLFDEYTIVIELANVRVGGMGVVKFV